jgi:hypothetical protein
MILQLSDRLSIAHENGSIHTPFKQHLIRGTDLQAQALYIQGRAFFLSIRSVERDGLVGSV